jgi:ABC-type uncharacterized transport system permease subunit
MNLDIFLENRNIILKSIVTILSVVAPLLIGAVMLFAVQINPIEAYISMFTGVFGSLNGIAETLVKATPLLLVALGITFAFRCGIWNIGAEGQLLIGAAAYTWVGIYVIPIAAPLHIIVGLLFAFMAGGFWGFIPGLIKVKFGANEIVSTLMMNFIAIYLINYLVSGPWKNPTVVTLNPLTSYIMPSAFLPILISRTRLHFGIVIAIIAAFLSYFFLYKTVFGFKIRACGSNLRAANFGGIEVGKTIAFTMLISGGLAGLAGMCEVAGVHHFLMDGISSSYGYAGISVCLLGKKHPIWVIFSSILFAVLLVGAGTMQQRVGVPIAIIQIIQALVIIFVLIGEVFTRRIV